jgi:putative ABC transport system permease protein
MHLANLKFAYRFFLKNKKHSIVNFIGLSLGLTLSSYLILFFFHGYTFDRYHKHKNEVYLLTMDIMSEGEVRMSMYPPIPVYDVLNNQLASVKRAARIYFETSPVIIMDEQVVYEGNLYRVDKSFFSLFDIGIVAGNENSLYTKKEAVFITQQVAEKYFGNKIVALGETINIGKKDYVIEGILKNPPSNSSLRYDFIAGTNADDVSSWNGFGDNPIYFQTTSHQEANRILSVLQEQVDNEYGAGSKRLNLIPFLKQHQELGQEEFLNINDKRYAKIYLTIGILILVISIINYINLATAQSITRFKDVALRKINGACRTQLVMQYLTESFGLTMLALVAATAMLYASLPHLNALAGSTIHWSTFTSAELVTAFLVILVLVSLCAGMYPALLLSGMTPLRILRSNSLKQGPGPLLRKCLIVLQFSMTSILIIVTLVVHGQLDFLITKELGFIKHQILSLSTSGNSWRQSSMNANYPAFKSEVSNLPGVSGVTICGLPGADSNIAVEYSLQGHNSTATLFLLRVDEDFTNVMAVTLSEGLNLNTSYPKKCLINKTAARLFFDGDAIGKELQGFEVTGVTEDFHFMGVYTSIEPLLIHLVDPEKPRFSTIQVKLSDDNVTATIESIREAWKKYSPELTFDYKFLDDRFNLMHERDKRTAKTFAVFSWISIVISCLGLVGLTSYTLKSRNKEISIRKIVGATIYDIQIQLIRGFLSPVLLSVLIAIPIAYFALLKYMENYAYRVDLAPYYFIVGGLFTISVVVLVTGLQTYTSARVNPVKTLREE